MLNEITAALGSLKAATDILGGMVALKNQSEVQAKVVELTNVIINLQHQLLGMQAEHATQTGRQAELEAQLRELSEWAVNKAHYRLHRFDAGGFVYRYKAQDDDDSAPHDLCTQCFEKHIKSILQAAEPEGWHKALRCPHCSSVVLVERIQSSGVTISDPPRESWRGF